MIIEGTFEFRTRLKSNTFILVLVTSVITVNSKIVVNVII